MLDKPHKRLDVWKKSMLLTKLAYEVTKDLPATESFGLVSQIRRAASSIPANIAEGAARNTKKEFVQFLHVARGSLSELDTHLELIRELRYVAENSLNTIGSVMEDVDRMINGLIKSLRK